MYKEMVCSSWITISTNKKTDTHESFADAMLSVKILYLHLVDYVMFKGGSVYLSGGWLVLRDLWWLQVNDVYFCNAELIAFTRGFSEPKEAYREWLQ